MTTQIIFYQILSGERTDLPKINIDSLSFDILTDYFEMALKITCNPIFQPNIMKNLDNGTFKLLRDSIKEIISLRPELLQYEVLALIFNTLIPFSLRKRIGAYYSGIKTAQLLSHFAIEDPSVKVFDPACGSGALLISSYQRKKEITKFRKGKFTITDHKRFLSSDITGIDIMPFAILLSTIHLAFQAPFYEFYPNRLAVHDSILLHPKSRLQQFLSLEKNVSAVKISQQLNLEFVDLVIMNPPFVRQESLRKIRPSYKDEIHQIFGEYSSLINKKMSYYCYFLFLADKFLKSGGRIAAVIPASFLRVETTLKMRKWLLEQYDIQYIICQQDKPNFSEDTAFREVLLVATKNGPTAEIEYILVKDIEKIESFEEVSDTWKRRKISCDELSSINLFLPIATMNGSSLLEIWQLISKMKDLVSIDTFLRLIKSGLKRGIETSRGFKIQNMVINEFRPKYLRPTDTWIFDNLKISIPKECLIPHLRRMSGENRLDISNKKEYVVISSFSELHNFIDANEETMNSISIRFNNWKTYVEARTTNLMVARRFDMCATGTSLFSYFSKGKRAPPGVMWSILRLSCDDAKILCLFFNSTLNTIQIFLNRVETRGSWMQLHEYVIKGLKIPN
ncbi:MAG: Eco57I restriction-modification methylase domain-containing protein, partial [Candidatus Hodarchaeales archaeon]